MEQDEFGDFLPHSQKKLIFETNWDFLLILDACRYDYFENIYRDYLSGELKRVRSGAIHTAEWLVKTFDSYYPDITYIASCPQVNSKGISLKDSNSNWDFDWKATDHFSKIIDVWDFGWSEQLGAVPPRIVNETVLQMKCKNREIVHYNQPHQPYLSLVEKSEVSGSKMPREKENHLFSSTGEKEDKDLILRFRRWFGDKLVDIFGREFFWELRKIAGKQPRPGGTEMAWRIGIDRCYEDNLRRVLKAVSSLLEDLEGKIVVTSDHGECFGEKRYWGHGYDGNKKIPHIPTLVEVPWLEVGN